MITNIQVPMKIGGGVRGVEHGLVFRFQVGCRRSIGSARKGCLKWARQNRHTRLFS